MTGKIVRALTIALSLSLLIFSVALAKGPPSKVTISGPGLAGEVEITDPDQLLAFSFFQFENIARKIEPPPTIGEGYVVTRYAQDGTKLVAWDRVIYYPGASGEVGIVFLEGIIGSSASEFDGYWYWASRDGDTVMRKILAEQKVTTLQDKPLATLSPITPTAFALSGLTSLTVVGLVVIVRRALRQAR